MSQVLEIRVLKSKQSIQTFKSYVFELGGIEEVPSLYMT